MEGSILLRRRHMKTTGKGLCVSLRTLRSLRLKNDLMANEVADQIADLMFGETQSSQRPQRNAKGSGGVRWREEVEVDNGGFIWYKKKQLELYLDKKEYCLNRNSDWI